MAEEDYNQIAKEQNYRCLICEGDNKGWHLAIDHDHNTGKVRGLLCNTCNRALGLFGENCVRLKKAIEYLKRSVTH